jgi:hypothetical protein
MKVFILFHNLIYTLLLYKFYCTTVAWLGLMVVVVFSYISFTVLSVFVITEFCLLPCHFRILMNRIMFDVT